MPREKASPQVSDFLADIGKRVLVFDGAMGTSLAAQGLSASDYGGHEGCPEALLLFNPQSVLRVHESFVSAGSRAVTTNTFGATRIVLAEAGLEDRVREINRLAVEVAKEALKKAPDDGLPGYVAASIGPGSKLPSLGHIEFDDLAAAYLEQVDALLDAGADILVVETCQDVLQAKAVLSGIRQAFATSGKRVPVIVSVTVEANGALLVGTDIAAAVTILSAIDIVDVLGLNCATGPAKMYRHVEYLSLFSPLPIIVQPNAGIPGIVGGQAVYNLSAEEFARFHRQFVSELGVRIVGGCCGTTPDHLRAVVDSIADIIPRTRAPKPLQGAAGLYHAVEFNQEPAPALVGERTNATGSRAFRDMLLAGDIEGMVSLARRQASGGAHFLDLCCAYAGRDEAADFAELVPRFAQQVDLPLIIDSTDPRAVRAALTRHGGKCIINSVSLESGREMLLDTVRLAAEFGAALVALTIDENGMALSAGDKLDVARKIYAAVVEETGFPAADLIFDTLTFTVASGDEKFRTAARETLEGIRLLKQEFPETWTSLGVSNVSFGLKPAARRALNSVFLSRARLAGLDLAIVNPREILPIHMIDGNLLRLAERLLDGDRSEGDPLAQYIEAFEGVKTGKKKRRRLNDPAGSLYEKVLEGEKKDLPQLLSALQRMMSPLEIINDILVRAMGEVGELFGAGKMQLPFVLASAETMKMAVGFLENEFGGREIAGGRGTVILATVRGDIHDIGKNLADIILSANGYKTVNLGIDVDVEEIVGAAQKNSADAIGLSGLLVKSTLVMKDCLAEMARRGLDYPVLVGGAALTPDFVDRELAVAHHGDVFYCRDAFDGLRALSSRESNGKGSEWGGNDRAGTVVELRPQETQVPVPREKPVDPPFFGARKAEFSLEEVSANLNRESLFGYHWGYKRGGLSPVEYRRFITDEIEPILNEWLELARRNPGVFHPVSRYGYFRCRREADLLIVVGEDGNIEDIFSFPRRPNKPEVSLVDYFREDEDIVVLFAVTIGEEATRIAGELFEKGRYRDYLHLHGLGVVLAEAVAETCHKRISKELGAGDGLRLGRRYAFGYPACPSLEKQEGLLALLSAGDIGITLTETGQMVPEQSTAGFIIPHPDAAYLR